YSRNRAQALAPDADWAEPELPRRASSETIATWLKDHPKNYLALGRLARQLINEQKWESAKAPLEEMRKLHPDDATANNPLALLADVYHELKDTAAERAALEKLAELTDDDVDTFSRLTELTAKDADWETARKHAQRWLAVNPLQLAPHRAAAAAASALG